MPCIWASIRRSSVRVASATISGHVSSKMRASVSCSCSEMFPNRSCSTMSGTSCSMSGWYRSTGEDSRSSLISKGSCFHRSRTSKISPEFSNFFSTINRSNALIISTRLMPCSSIRPTNCSTLSCSIRRSTSSVVI
uniref:(northern house mosquito) hypothetical protein n=1 Tax=Culex pipiens TaxID=7175 RepID=A0A8D8G3F7_CULPI